MVDTKSELPRGLRRTFRSLAIPNYRLFFTGQVISVVGTWMQRVAQDWLILELGGGPLELSIGVALQSFPVLFLGLWGGLLTDRMDARRLFLAAQISLAVLAAALGGLVIADLATLPIVYVAALSVGLVGVVESPSRQATILDIVGPDNVANAMSLNGSINNIARLLGPAVAGLAIGVLGTGVAYLANATTFVGIIVALWVMDRSSMQPRTVASRAKGQVIEGLRYSWADSSIRRSVLAVLLVSAFAQNFRVTLPLLAAGVFASKADGYGLLMSALGGGALAGALVCAHLSRVSLRRLGAYTFLFGALLTVAAVAPTLAVLAVLMIGVGAGNTSFNTTANSLVLLRAKAEMRGRVFALKSLVSQGATPFGSVGIGYVCEVVGPRAGLALGGIIALLTCTLLVRPTHDGG